MSRGTRRPRKPPYDTSAAVAALTLRDPALGRLIAHAGPFTLKLDSAQSPFEALLQSIVYQQLHGKAAAAIHGRLLNSFGTAPDEISPLAAANHAHPTAQDLLDCPNEQLRAAGLSGNKALAVRDLAAQTLDGTVPTLARIRRMNDEAIIERLSEVRGIGRWTVEMFLIFRLGRADVLPVTDYGVRRGFALTFGRSRPTRLKSNDKVTSLELPNPDEMHRRAKRWHPWCSVASWYLWRACDLADEQNKGV